MKESRRQKVSLIACSDKRQMGIMLKRRRKGHFFSYWNGQTLSGVWSNKDYQLMSELALGFRNEGLVEARKELFLVRTPWRHGCNRQKKKSSEKGGDGLDIVLILSMKYELLILKEY
ncbi:hypothetical protein NPIL_468591 [Nephila pilipes]|uniref:Uncharacterized protein n=1 Tax=Nephila pilipes TaxID=299642 RepID=A0A8X6UA81_NEPPI|nr:hypothetical protein NPIL_468591 [Nephila pilipes]